LRARIGELEQLLERALKGALAASRTIGVAQSEALVTPVPAQAVVTIDAEQRRRMVEEIAYLHAELRGFVGGDPAEDWRSAEAAVDHILAILAAVRN